MLLGVNDINPRGKLVLSGRPCCFEMLPALHGKRAQICSGGTWGLQWGHSGEGGAHIPPDAQQGREQPGLGEEEAEPLHLLSAFKHQFSLGFRSGVEELISILAVLN